MIGDVTCEATTLVPGASTTCTGSYTVTQDDVDSGEIVNVAHAVGVGPGSEPVASDEDDETVLTDTRDELLLLKQSIDTGDERRVGDVIDYTFDVTNTGTTNITDITVSDPLITDITCPASELGPGESMTCTGSYTITQADADAGEVVNTAIANGTPPADRPQVESPSSTDETTVGLTDMPGPQPKPQPVQPEPAPAKVDSLPQTGTSMAFVALLGASMLAAGAQVMFGRRNNADVT